MLLLGIDTATRVGSVGLVRAPLDGIAPPLAEPGRVADGCVEIAEVARDTGLAHGAEILALIDACLERGGVAIEEIGCIAVSCGPGSFTGLRVALATAKGLALGGDVPLVGVPTLEALAATVVPAWTASSVPASTGTVVAACLDARKGEVYAAGFVIREPAWAQPNPRLERRSGAAAWKPAAFAAELTGWLGGAERPALLLGDGAQRYAEQILVPLGARVRVLSFPEYPPRGAIVARLGAGLFAQSGGHDRAALVPSYARASEAEIVRARRSGEPEAR